MKILYFIPSMDRKTGGTAFYLKSLVNSINKKDSVIKLITKRTDHGIKLDNCEMIYVDLSLKKSLSLFFTFNKILKEFKPDVVHINVIWMVQSFIFHLSCTLKNINVLLSLHGMMEPWILNRNRLKKKIALFLYQKWSIKKAKMIHVTSKLEYDNFSKLELNENISLIPNGIDCSIYSLKNNWERSNSILFLSRIHPKKGIENLIEIVHRNNSLFKSYEINVCGEGEASYVANLKSLVRSKGLEKIICFQDGVYGANKIQKIQSADILVLPTYSENFGIVVAEALSCGTPVLTTTGTPWERINSVDCGWCVKPNLIDIERSLLDYLKLDSESLKLKGLNGRKWMEEEFSINIIGMRTYQVYKSLQG